MTDLDLSDPDTYLNGPPHDYFTELRATDPVHWQPVGDRGYWAVLKHPDVETVARQPLLFSSAARGIVLEDLEGERLEQMRGMLLAMDPPKHRQVRKPLTPRMTPRALGGLEDGIRAICADIFDVAAQVRDVEFVDDVAAALPTRVVGALMGLPREDWEHVHHMSEAITHGQDPDYASKDGGDAADATTAMGTYAYQFAVDRAAREPEGDGDITDAMLAVMDPVAFAMLFIQLVTAGQDTTQTMLSSGLLALLDHPVQLAALRDDPSRIPAAVEEIVRWANPLHYFRRTATADTVIGDTKIAAGDAVAMYYTSCNRDEDVFADSQAFDVTRTPNKHLGFGQAEHFCVGVHLARMEGRIFYEELLKRFSTIEQAGEPKRLRSNLNNSYKSVPVSLGA